MARVPYPSREAYPVAYRSAYDRMLQERGDPAPNIFLAFGNIPNLMEPLLALTKEMKAGAAIEQRLRELSIVTVGLITGCDYEFGHHWNIALKAGVRRAQLEQLDNAEASPEFDVVLRGEANADAEQAFAIHALLNQLSVSIRIGLSMRATALYQATAMTMSIVSRRLRRPLNADQVSSETSILSVASRA